LILYGISIVLYAERFCKREMTLGLHVNVGKETFGQRQNEIRQQFKKNIR